MNKLIKRSPRTTLATALSVALMFAAGGVMAQDANIEARTNADARADVDRDSDQPINDTWITTKVKSSLLADTDVAGLQVNVETVNGVVSLSGDVESQAQIQHAERIARDIEGVTRVDTSGLRVEARGDRDTWTGTGERARTGMDSDARARTGTDTDTRRTGGDSDQPINDTWITTKVKSSLLADTDVAGLQVNVETVNGVVSLSGDVESQAQIQHAERIARDIEGVSRVDTSGLRVEARGDRDTWAGTGDRDRTGMDSDTRARTGTDADARRIGGDSDQPVNDTWITTKVKSSLLADTDVAGLQISVETVNGVVSLSGDVDSQAQIQHAERIARDIEGVSRVDTSGLTATGE